MDQNSRLSGRNILVVEDRYVIALDLCEMLQSEGCRVVGPVSTIEEARDLMREQPVDLAIMNVSIDDGRSFPIARQLRAEGVPFIFTTGFNDLARVAPDDLKDAPCIRKPFTEEHIIDAVTRLTRRGDEALKEG